MEELLPLEPDYNHQFTQGELNSYDFRGWDIRRLPYGVKKAARGGVISSHMIDGQVECVGCKNMVWAVNPKLENICEGCDYYTRSDIWDMRAARAKRNSMKMIDPFAESEASSVLFNPFRDEE